MNTVKKLRGMFRDIDTNITRDDDRIIVSDDFMANGRQQPAMQTRDELNQRDWKNGSMEY